jgi:molybdenum cofactor biosynthesis enzyme MoaA
LAELVKVAKDSGIPNVSITTNGNLLTKEKLDALVDSGLDEIILSAHGLSREVYERMMTGASFDRFTSLMADLASVKERYPSFHVRVNYTICADNIDDLMLLPDFFSQLKPDVIQLRPVQDIGSAVFSNYSMESLVSKYKTCIGTVVDFCQSNGILCLYPQVENINVISTENSEKQHLNSMVDLIPYFHLSPYEGWQKEFDPYTETFESFAKRTHRVRSIIRMLLGVGKPGSQLQDGVTHALNYSVG